MYSDLGHLVDHVQLATRTVHVVRSVESHFVEDRLLRLCDVLLFRKDAS